MQKVLEFVVANWDAIAGLVGTLVVWLWSRPVIQGRVAMAQAKLNELHLAKAAEIAKAVVAEMYQTTVRELKATGKFDAKTKAAIAASAGAKLKSELAAQDLGFLSALTPSLIEMAVNALKNDAPYSLPKTVPVEGPELPQ
jgi:hypothetical protein